MKTSPGRIGTGEPRSNEGERRPPATWSSRSAGRTIKAPQRDRLVCGRQRFGKRDKRGRRAETVGGDADFASGLRRRRAQLVLCSVNNGKPLANQQRQGQQRAQS